MTANVRQQGMEALKAGRFADAARYLSGFISSAPNDSQARLAFAIALSSRGDHDKALIHLDKLLNKTPNSVSLHFQRGQILERAKRIGQAKQEFRRVLELDPKHAKAKAKLNTAKKPANTGFEVVEEEPGFEVVDDEFISAEASDADEHVMDAAFAGDSANVIEADIFEEIWVDEGKPFLDGQTIAKYIVLSAAIVGASVFGFMTLSPMLAWTLMVAIAFGGSLLIAADLMQKWNAKNFTSKLCYALAIILLIGGVVGVILLHFITDPDLNEAIDRNDYRSSDVKARFDSPQPLSAAQFERVTANLSSGNRSKIIMALGRLQVALPNASRETIAGLIETHLQSTDFGILHSAVLAAKTWGTKSNLASLKRLTTHASPLVSRDAKSAIKAIEIQP